MRRPGRKLTIRCVVITIELDGTQPPTGRVRVAGCVASPFVGWLGLLRLLSDLVDGPDPSALRR